ncbi:MAG: hypothetical protein RID91_15835 [Azospirillaceae bacterium]
MLAEIPEDQATGRVAALYDRIRAESGSSLVNFVWRHLATIDGAAEWGWSVARLNGDEESISSVSETADGEAQSIVERATGVAPLDLGREGRIIVEIYNRNNAANLFRMAVIKAALTGAADVLEGAVPCGPAAPPQDRSRIPPLPSAEQLGDGDAACIERLGAAGPASDTGIPPSLWRHLAVVPGGIEQVAGAVTPLLGGRLFRRAYDRLRSRADELARRRPVAVPGAATFDRRAALDGVERFYDRIGELTLAGRLVALLDSEGSAPHNSAMARKV